MTLTTEQLHRFAPSCSDPSLHAAAIATAIPGSSINSPLRLAHFLAQAYVETRGFRALEENLRYSNPERLDTMFRAVRGVDDARQLIAAGPEAIANRVYAGRLGNGDEASGDGWKYRGRGYLMLTGRANYRFATGLTPDPVLEDPWLAGTPGPAARIAVALWDRWHLSPLADGNDLRGITRRINGEAMVGLEERAAALACARRVLGCD